MCCNAVPYLKFLKPVLFGTWNLLDFQKQSVGAGEFAEWLRVPAALPGDPK